LRLSEDELVFYHAVETNDSAVKVLGDDTLRTIARELVAAVRKNVTIDWMVHENVRAQLRIISQAHPAQVRLSPGQAGKGHADRA
jgi:type I restriction enzyme R subunit